ncbi:MAG: isoprenylcysteine carboxylmethyltransferase family protein [Sandaracinaceae bacterium]
MRRAILQRIASTVALTALFGGMLFLGAGTFWFPRAWVFLGLSLALFTMNLLWTLRANPAAIEARAKVGEGTKPFERWFGLVFGVAALAMHFSIGLQTVRLGEPAFGAVGLGIGAVLMVVGDVPIAWAMATNPHIEKTVRIQKDRGHVVISSGPYAIVRHPMYVGLILQYAGVPLYFGSWWGAVAAAVAIGALVVRTALEDRTLRAELPGYADYAEHQTRHRLLPGVW